MGLGSSIKGFAARHPAGVSGAVGGAGLGGLSYAANSPSVLKHDFAFRHGLDEEAHKRKIKLDSPAYKKLEKERLRSTRLHSTIGGAAVGAGLGAAYGATTHAIKKEQQAWRDHFHQRSQNHYRAHDYHEGFNSHTYRGSRGAGGYRKADHTSYGVNADHLHSHVGTTGKETTKAEAKAAYRATARKHHPDRPGGSAEQMKKTNDAWDKMQGSDWFRKLAQINELTCRSNFWAAFEHPQGV